MPYLSTGLTHSSSEQISIAVQMEDAGYGLLSGDDVITISGSVVVEWEAIVPTYNSNHLLTTVVTPLVEMTENDSSTTE